MPRPLRQRKAPNLRVALAAVIFASVFMACGTASSTPVAWEAAQVTPTDRSLTVTYGLDSCQDLDRIEVGYRRTAVTVTIFAVPNHNACRGLRFVRTVDVPLREPLAGRDVLDGARAR